MMTTKLLNPMRQIAKLNAGLRSFTSPHVIASSFSTTPVSQSKHLRVWRPFDDTFFDMASRLMRNLEREFDWVSRQTPSQLTNRMWSQLEKPIMQGGALNDLIVTDKDGNRKFQLMLELSDFQPEEIKIKTHGHTLNISAKKENQSADQYYLREFSQSYSLPKELKLEDLKSRWTDDGCLIVDAPLPKQQAINGGNGKSKIKEIPIEHGQQQQQQQQKSIEDKPNKS